MITEAAHLLQSRPNEVQAMLSGFQTGFFSLAPLNEADVFPVQGIMDRYADQEFDLADACLMHIADSLGRKDVFTLDLKDFGVFRKQDGLPLSIVPIDGLL